MLVAFVVIGVLLGLGPMLLGHLLFGTGPIWSRSWPAALQVLIDALPEADRKDLHGIKAYCIVDSLDSEYVWRLNVPPRIYDHLKQSLEVKVLPIPDPSDTFWRKPPRWWDPNPQANAECMVWYADQFEVVTLYDKKNEVLYGWCQNDFYVHGTPPSLR